MKATFQSRCEKAMKVGDLTVADLKAWFGRPYTTVWRWVNSGWEPRGPDGRKALANLERLEKAVGDPALFPIPDHVSSRLREAYVRNAYHAADRARLPQADSSRRGS